MKDWNDGFIHVGQGTISLFSTGVKDCDAVQSFNPILSEDMRDRLTRLFKSNFAEFNSDIGTWQDSEDFKDFQNWRSDSNFEFRISDNFTVKEHKERWDGESPFPEHAKENVEMPMFNVFDGGNGDGLVTIAEHKGRIVVEGTLWEKDGSINIWVKF